MRATASLVALLIVPCLVVGPAAAQFEADSSAPIEITADAMEWMDNERIAVARGNADAIQGRYRLFADVLTAHLLENDEGENGAASGNGIRLIEADGNVRLVTPDEVVTGANGDYDVENRQVSLQGDVVLTQGENVARGDRLDMDLTTGVSRLTALPSSGGRVSAIFTPESEEESGESEGATE